MFFVTVLVKLHIKKIVYWLRDPGCFQKNCRVHPWRPDEKWNWVHTALNYASTSTDLVNAVAAAKFLFSVVVSNFVAQGTRAVVSDEWYLL